MSSSTGGLRCPSGEERGPLPPAYDRRISTNAAESSPSAITRSIGNESVGMSLGAIPPPGVPAAVAVLVAVAVAPGGVNVAVGLGPPPIGVAVRVAVGVGDGVGTPPRATVTL